MKEMFHRMTIVLFAESKKEYDDLMLDQRYGKYKELNQKVKIIYNKKKLGRPTKKSW